MKYYFGLVPDADVNMFGDEGLYEHNTEFYYNMIEFGTNPGGMEDFVIADGVGRSIPISVEQIDVLMEVLADIKDKLDTLQQAEQIQSEIFNPNHVETSEFEW